VLEYIGGYDRVERALTKRELSSASPAVVRASPLARESDRCGIGLYTNDSAERSIGLGVPAGAAPIIEDPQGARLRAGGVPQKIDEHAPTPAEPPVAEL
jgi:hypothetical protein